MKFTSKSINWQIKIFTGTRFNFYLKILSINSLLTPYFKLIKHWKINLLLLFLSKNTKIFPQSFIVEKNTAWECATFLLYEKNIKIEDIELF